jgi:hypothetical protein
MFKGKRSSLSPENKDRRGSVFGSSATKGGGGDDASFVTPVKGKAAKAKGKKLDVANLVKEKGGKGSDKAVEYAELLLRPKMPPLDKISELKITLRGATKAWLEGFYEAGGLTALVMKLSDVEGIEEKADEDVQIQVELLKCLKASLNNQQGIDFLAARPEVVGILALNFGSEDVFICTQALELLAVLMVDGPQGYRAVLAAMDYFKLVKGERVSSTLLAPSSLPLN